MLAGGLYERTSGAAGQPLGSYQRRASDRTVLHELVARHAQSMLAELRDADPEGGGLPRRVFRTACPRSSSSCGPSPQKSRCNTDLAPAQVYATLLDEGRDLCSERTTCRVLAANHEVRERRAQLMHLGYDAPELLAPKPNGPADDSCGPRKLDALQARRLMPPGAAGIRPRAAT